MKQEIIDKFGLHKAKENFGQTFIYNIPIYSYQDDYRLAKCTTTGEPDEKFILIWRTGSIKYLRATESFLQTIDRPTFDKILSGTWYKEKAPSITPEANR